MDLRKKQTKARQAMPEKQEDRREDSELLRIAKALEKLDTDIVRLFTPPGSQAKGFTISQIIGGNMQADIIGIKLGAVGQFTGVPTPAGGLTTGIPKWSADDPNVSLTPSADGSAVAVQTSATDTAASFNLTQSGADGLGNPISSSVNVPLLATTPPPVQASGFDIKQSS
jgi:hypothetical protein